MTDPSLERTAIEPEVVERLLTELDQVTWNGEGRVALLVETPTPHRHVVRKHVDVVPGKGFAGDHAKKSYYRGRYVPGREVSAMTREVLEVLDVEPSAVGDNLITEGVDLARLREGECMHVGDVLLERSTRAHRPCKTFRDRSSPEAFAVVSRHGYRGALFVVRTGGVIRQGDPIRVLGQEKGQAGR